MGNLQVPVYLTVGNHDHFGLGALVYPYLVTFDSYSTAPTSNLHLLALDSGGFDEVVACWKWVYIGPLPYLVPIFDLPPEGSGLTSAQWDWLTDHIDDFPNYNKIVAMHHPVVSYSDDDHVCGAERCEGCIAHYRSDVAQLCASNNVKLVLGGHLHSSLQYYLDEASVRHPLHAVELPESHHQYSGYTSVGNNDGYWSSNGSSPVPNLPMYVVTAACGEDLAYRRIEVGGDDVRVYRTSYLNENEHLHKYKCEYIPWPWVGASVAGARDGVSDYVVAGRLHLYDSAGNHVGADPLGAIDFEIPGAYYEDEPVEDEGNSFVRVAQDEVLSLLVDESESYTWEIEVFIDAKINLFGTVIMKDGGGTTTATYSNIEVAAGSKGYLRTVHGMSDHTLYWDDDADGAIARELQPDQLVCEKRPYQPEGPTGAVTGNVAGSYSYSTTTTDPEGDQVFYLCDWGDGTDSGWLGPYDSGSSCTVSHQWVEVGAY
ncbi:MAG: metallophosphoesterase, partial [Phycisphaerae bacterium]